MNEQATPPQLDREERERRRRLVFWIVVIFAIACGLIALEVRMLLQSH